ncbi:MAG: hypothetical protein HY599_00550 [Candidatus Omnitrophica bacterium]|nr:hypothetical protein [Candidatus Omnitrophota bacterium]
MAIGIVSVLLIVMGLISAGVGALVARHALRAAHRTHHRTVSLSPATLDGWDAWFLDGFSALTAGIRWLSALGVWLGWTVAGAGLMWLGLRLLQHG